MKSAKSLKSFQFFLGSHRAVSLAELISLKLIKSAYFDFQNKTSITENNIFVMFKESVVVSSAYTKNKILQKANMLGGSPKIAQVVAIQRIKVPNQVIESIKNILIKDITNLSKTNQQKKFFATFNFYADISKTAKHAKIEIKKALKQEGISLKILGRMQQARVNSATTNLVFSKNGLEFNITYSNANKILVISKTIFVQEYRLWQRLDYQKPHRDMKVGMLPSKLARIMLNLAKIDENKGFWDPFVGLGTTIMQGQFFKAYSYGSDIDHKVLPKAEENVKWLLKSGSVRELRYNIFKFNVLDSPKSNKMLRSIIRHGRFDALVTEGYLGYPQKKPFKNISDAKREWRKVSHLYKALTKIQLPALKVQGRLVVTVPMYKYKSKTGYKWFIPEFDFNAHRLKPISFKVGNLDWINKDSVVGRRLYVLERIK